MWFRCAGARGAYPGSAHSRYLLPDAARFSANIGHQASPPSGATSAISGSECSECTALQINPIVPWACQDQTDPLPAALRAAHRKASHEGVSITDGHVHVSYGLHALRLRRDGLRWRKRGYRWWEVGVAFVGGRDNRRSRCSRCCIPWRESYAQNPEAQSVRDGGENDLVGGSSVGRMELCYANSRYRHAGQTRKRLSQGL